MKPQPGDRLAQAHPERTEMLEQWDLWVPAVGATGLSFARSEAGKVIGVEFYNHS